MAASFRALFEQLGPTAEPRTAEPPRPKSGYPAFGTLAELLHPQRATQHRAAPVFGALADLLTAAPRPTPVVDKPIVLIACSDTKVDTNGRAVPAADLYASPLFRKSLAYARAITTEENIRILSGLHGVLRTSDRIATYDYPITKLSARERDEWGERAHTTLLGQFGQKQSRAAVVLAGEEYVLALHGLTNPHRRDALPWTITYPFGVRRGARMQIGERLRWLNEQLHALGREPAPAPKKPAPLKPGRVRLSTRGRPWQQVEALAWEGDFFVHADLDDEDTFAISHAPTGRAWVQRFTDERSATVYAADLNSAAVRPVIAKLIEAVERKQDDLMRSHSAALGRLLSARDPLRAAEYKRRYGHDAPRDAVAPRSEREPQSLILERSPAPVPAPPHFANLAQLLGGAEAVPPAPQSETRRTTSTAPASESSLKEARTAPVAARAPSFANLAASLGAASPSAPAVEPAPLSAAAARERALIVAYLKREAAAAAREKAKLAAQRLRVIADDIAKASMPPADLRRMAIERLVEQALLKTAEELRASKHDKKGKSAASQADERQPVAATKPGDEVPATVRSMAPLRQRVLAELLTQSRSAEIVAGILGVDVVAVREHINLLLQSGALYVVETPPGGPPEYMATTAPLPRVNELQREALRAPSEPAASENQEADEASVRAPPAPSGPVVVVAVFSDGTEVLGTPSGPGSAPLAVGYTSHQARAHAPLHRRCKRSRGEGGVPLSPAPAPQP